MARGARRGERQSDKRGEIRKDTNKKHVIVNTFTLKEIGDKMSSVTVSNKSLQDHFEIFKAKRKVNNLFIGTFFYHLIKSKWQALLNQQAEVSTRFCPHFFHDGAI